MINIESLITKYIEEKKELQRLILQIIESSDNDDKDFQNLQNFLETQGYDGDKPELEHFLHLILIISMNHSRQPNFFQKIEKILTITSKFYKPTFSNDELFSIFKEYKPILLSLLKTNIIIIDEIIFENLLDYSEPKEGEIYYYFYPEISAIIESRSIENINAKNNTIKLNEDIENFKRNRQQYENDSRICSIIREDMVQEFVKYVNKNSISVNSEIKLSIFETNPIFIEKDPTLIEYATFFGAIQIMQYLANNGAEVSSTLWLYAVHSNNAEVIQFLEDKNVKIDNQTFSEAIKCHHNSIANYIYENYFDDGESDITNLDDESVLNIYLSANYQFFHHEIDGNKIFYSLCKSNYMNLVDLYLQLKNKNIVSYINEHKNGSGNLIRKALEENRIDVAYQLMKQLSAISSYYFNEDTNMTKIALPPNIHSIERGGFYKCSSLKHISIPSSVTSIDNVAFLGCSSLREIEIPSSVTHLGNVMFYLCPALSKVKLSSSLKRIDDCTFQATKELKQIVIPHSVTVIGSLCFDSCSKLKKVFLPSTLTKIENSAFYKCSALEEIIIHSSVSKIEKCAFKGCSSLKLVLFASPSSLQIIEENTFQDCSSLKQISIPSSVSLIEKSAFNNCLSLKQISIPSSLIIDFVGIPSDTEIIKI